MLNLFRKKSRLEKLEERYTCLMRKSFKTALRDTEKSEELHRQADEILNEIHNLSLQYS